MEFYCIKSKTQNFICTVCTSLCSESIDITRGLNSENPLKEKLANQTKY